MPYGTVNADVIQTSTSGGILGAGNASIMKNRIINGAMVVNQRGGTTTINSSAYTYSVDRFFGFGESSDGVYTLEQSTTAPTGFNNSLKVTITTADSSITSTQRYFIGQKIEGYNIADMGFGTASAKTFTISAQVQSSVTGTFGGVLMNDDFNRAYPFTYTISSANTWTPISITIAGDTTGTWLTTNDSGLNVFFSIGAGSARLGTAGAWQTPASPLFGATGQTNLIATNGATLFLTGVQLEVGSSATGYEYENYTSLLQKCQRYYQVIPRLSWNQGQANRDTATQSYHGQMLISQMRVAPTVAGFNTSGNTSTSATRYGPNGEFEQTNWTTALTSTFNISTQSFAFLTTFAGATTFEPKALVTVNNAGFTMSAEL